METISVAATPLKAGATLFFVETTLTADDEQEPFATSLATFMNRPVTLVNQFDLVDTRLDRPFHLRIGAEVLSPGVVELELSEDILNGHHGTVQGGVLATVGELAAESLCSGTEAHLVSELDIRFLNRVKVGPVRGVAFPIVEGRQGKVVVVKIMDAGDDMRPVAHVSTVCIPVRDAG
jgi:uncharacterized protein (TIGR00369 family)